MATGQPVLVLHGSGGSAASLLTPVFAGGLTLGCRDVDAGKQIIRESGLNVLPADDLDDAAQKIVKAVKGATVPLLRGPITFRAFDNVSNSPVYVGRLAKDPRYPFLILKDIQKIGVEASMISVEEVKKLREAAK